jgi:hypothetical protein
MTRVVRVLFQTRLRAGTRLKLVVFVLHKLELILKE